MYQVWLNSEEVTCQVWLNLNGMTLVLEDGEWFHYFHATNLVRKLHMVSLWKS